MNKANRVLALVMWLLSCSFSALAAEGDPGALQVLSSNLSRPAISELIPLFEKSYNAKVQVQYANNPILKQQIEAGAGFDVVIIEPQMLHELAKAGFAVEDSVVELASIGMALVSREGAPAVDTRSVESFKKVLISANSIAYTADGHSGVVFLRTLEKLGLGEEMKHKLVPVVGRFSTLAVAEGSAEYTAFPLAGSVPGVQVAGQFPDALQTFIGIAAARHPQSVEAELSGEFLKYLQSDSAKQLFRSKGYTPSPARQE